VAKKIIHSCSHISHVWEASWAHSKVTFVLMCESNFVLGSHSEQFLRVH